jgi:hypothetical protein
MGKAVPEQHPAVVLRSHYVHLRALLAAALIAILGLTATVVIVANDSDQATVSTSAPAPAIEYGGTGATGVPQSAPLPERRLDGAVDSTPAPRYDGGPDEGSADIRPGVNIPARPSQSQAFPGAADQAGDIGRTASGAARYDGGPNEGSADVQLRGSKASSSTQSTDPRYDGGPNEGSADVTTTGGGEASLMPQTDGFRYSGN